jgi:hypothetical protein
MEVALDGITAAPQGAVVPHRYKWINHCALVYSILPLQIIRIKKMMGGNFCTVPKPMENLLTSPRVLRSASWIVWFTTKIYRRINKVANASSVQPFLELAFCYSP